MAVESLVELHGQFLMRDVAEIVRGNCAASCRPRLVGEVAIGPRRRILLHVVRRQPVAFGRGEVGEVAPGAQCDGAQKSRDRRGVRDASATAWPFSQIAISGAATQSSTTAIGDSNQSAMGMASTGQKIKVGAEEIEAAAGHRLPIAPWSATRAGGDA